MDGAIPRSKIYVSATPTAASSSTDPRSLFQLDGAQGITHFYLVLSSELYTKDLIENCNGRLACFNCTRPIAERVYFFPTRFDEQATFECSQIPHCRSQCMMRTVLTLPNNFDLLTNLFNMYGDTTAAPPRELLYIPGGVTLDRYHQLIEEGVVMELEPPNVQSFIGPIFMSSAVLRNHQMVESSHQALERLAARNALDITEALSDVRGPSVVMLPQNNLFEGPLALFDVDPSTMNCMQTNLHMAK